MHAPIAPCGRCPLLVDGWGVWTFKPRGLLLEEGWFELTGE
jgi:hypothetical protein